MNGVQQVRGYFRRRHRVIDTPQHQELQAAFARDVQRYLDRQLTEMLVRETEAELEHDFWESTNGSP